MFYNKKKKQKLDPKVRFQHRQFTQKLDKARNFKRTPRALPETKFDEVLSKIYLGNRWSQIAAGLGILGILYLVYAPNFISVKAINVEGIPQSEQKLVEASVRDAISKTPFYNPQNNLVFLSTDLVKSAAMKVSGIYDIKSVKKDFQTKEIRIAAIPKTERFLVSDDSKVYSVFNDGSFDEVTGMSVQQWNELANPQIIKLKIHGNHNGELAIGSPFLQDSLRDSLEVTNKSISGITGSSLDYILLGQAGDESISLSEANVVQSESEALQTPISSPELRVVMKKGIDKTKTFTIIFDARADLHSAVDRLNLLLSQMPPDRYVNLGYIDMRIENRGYVCLINSKCDN